MDVLCKYIDIGNSKESSYVFLLDPARNTPQFKKAAIFILYDQLPNLSKVIFTLSYLFPKTQFQST